MNPESDLLVMRTIASPLIDAWNVLTARQDLWWPSFGFELREGAPLRARWTEGRSARAMTGTIERVNVPYDLTFTWTEATWFRSGVQQNLTVTVQLSSHAGKTVMAVRESGFDGIAVTPKDLERLKEQRRATWTELIDALAAAVVSPEAKLPPASAGYTSHDTDAEAASQGPKQITVHESQAAILLAGSLMNSLEELTSAARLDLLSASNSVGKAAQPHPRLVVGIVGKPGSGKSTLTNAIAQVLSQRGVNVAVLPMDGFHLSNAQLHQRGLTSVKGAPETFDSSGFAATLERVVRADHDVFVPVFHRNIEESYAADGCIPVQARIVLVEGNYLLLNELGFKDVTQYLSTVWFIQPDDHTRVERLVQRHVAHGKAPQDAIDWAMGTDQRNADRIASTAHRADLIVNLR